MSKTDIEGIRLSLISSTESKKMRSGGARVISLSKCLLVAIVTALVTTAVLWVSHTASPPIKQQIGTEEDESYNKVIEQPISVLQYSGSIEGQAEVHNDRASQNQNDGGRLLKETKKSNSEQIAKYKAAAETARDRALALLLSSGWSTSGGNRAKSQGIVSHMSTSEWGAIFKLEGTIDIGVDVLFDDLVSNSENVPQWNPSVLQEYVVEKLDNSTDVSYNVAASNPMISSRDFVYVRHWEKKDGWYLVSSISVTHPSTPVYKAYVRGVQNPTIIRMKEITARKLQFEWLLNIDFKGSLLRMFVNSALPGAMRDYLKYLQTHAATLQGHATTLQGHR